MSLPVIREQTARSILSRTSGFIARAGFTHSLTFGVVLAGIPVYYLIFRRAR